MKAKLEYIETGIDSSFTIRDFTNVPYSQRSQWHYHPEYEIVYISRGRGKRHIGSHVSYFEDGDLIFLGPDLPHYGFTEEVNGAHQEIVLQMKPDFLGQSFLGLPEMRAVHQMFARSHQGLSFDGKTKEDVGRTLKYMLEAENFDRLIRLLEILQRMAGSEEYEILQASGYSVEVEAKDHDRMQVIYEYVENNFQEDVSLEEVSRLAAMTVPAFCRYFKRLTRKTFIQFVNEYRIAMARRLLADDSLTVSQVAMESGFNNLSHFNRQFRSLLGSSPTDYRKTMVRKVVD